MSEFNLIHLLKQFYLTLLDLIYPERGICFICEDYDEDTGDDHICATCKKQLTFIGDHHCSICGKPLEKGYPRNTCPYCTQNKRRFTQAMAPLEYEDHIKQAIYKFKYHRKTYLYRAFGPLMLSRLKTNSTTFPTLIVPVPLHPRKKATRGFNQAALLGKYIAKDLDIPVDTKYLIRTQNTIVQNKLKKKARQDNVKNAFKVKDEAIFKDQNILLIDDILTTGATVEACCKVLLKAGAKSVMVLTLATGRQT